MHVHRVLSLTPTYCQELCQFYDIPFAAMCLKGLRLEPASQHSIRLYHADAEFHSIGLRFQNAGTRGDQPTDAASGAETGEETRSEIDTGSGAIGEIRLVGVTEDDFGNLFEGGELGDCVGNPMHMTMLEEVPGVAMKTLISRTA